MPKKVCPTTKGTIEGNNRRSSVYTLHKWCVNAYAIGCGVLWGTCNNGTMVPHKEIQWNNGTPEEKFYSLATFGHNREDNQVPHKCHVYGVGVCAYGACLQRRHTLTCNAFICSKEDQCHTNKGLVWRPPSVAGH